MPVKPIRPNVTLPVERTPEDVQRIIDELQQCAREGVMSGLAVAYILDGQAWHEYAHDGDATSMVGAANMLAHQVTYDATFDE